MTNTTIPPVLSKVHHDEVTERVQVLKAELRSLLQELDDMLDAAEPTPQSGAPAAA